MPGRVAEKEDRQVERVAELHEARGLVGAVAVDRAGEVERVVGDDAERAALDARQRGDHAGAEAAAQLEHRAAVGERLDDRAHVVDAQAVLRDDVAQPTLVGAVPVRERALEVREVLLRDAHRLGLVGDGDVDDAVGRLHGDRADLVGAEHAEAAAFDHRRAAHADVRVLRRDDDVAAAEQRGVAGEAAAGDDADQRHEAAQPAEVAGTPGSRARRRRARRCRPGVRRRPRRRARPAGAAARRARTGGPSCGGSGSPACRRARCSRTTSRRSGARSASKRWPLTVPMPATRPSAGVRAMRSSSARRLRCAASARAPYSTKLPGSQRSSMFSRAVRWPVCRRRATASGRRGVETDGVALDGLGEIGAQRVRILVVGVGGGRQRARVGRGQEDERRTLGHRVARGDREGRAPCRSPARRRRAPSSSPPSPAAAGRRAPRRRPTRRR